MNTITLESRKSAVSLAVHTVAHAGVDFACFYMLFSLFAKSAASPAALAEGFLVYNILAFGLQPLIGYLCDIRKNVPSAVAGCLLVIPGLFMTSAPWLAMTICALGNAFFHVGGGIDSLINAKGRMSRSGVFVSGGAMGVALGTLSGKSGLPGVWLPALLLALSAGAILFVNPFPSKPISPGIVRFQTADARRPAEIIVLLSALSIVIRAFGGSAVPMGWRTTPFLVLAAATAALTGKAAGGFAADRLGARTVGVASLLLSLPFLAFGYSDPLLCCVGLVLFNISMPVTLCAIYSVLPFHPGLSFGLTTLALLSGTVPVFFVSVPATSAGLPIAALTALSAASLFLALGKRKGGLHHEQTIEPRRNTP